MPGCQHFVKNCILRLASVVDFRELETAHLVSWPSVVSLLSLLSCNEIRIFVYFSLYILIFLLAVLAVNTASVITHYLSGGA